MTGEDGTVGFCRTSIPAELMSGTFHVFVNGTETPYSTVYSNSTHNYIYFNYTHSTEQVVIAPEFPSFLILLLLTVATLPVVIAYKRRRSKSFREDFGVTSACVEKMVKCNKLLCTRSSRLQASRGVYHT